MIPKAVCPKCGRVYYGWALKNPIFQHCLKCAAKLKPSKEEKVKMPSKNEIGRELDVLMEKIALDGANVSRKEVARIIGNIMKIENELHDYRQQSQSNCPNKEGLD